MTQPAKENLAINLTTPLELEGHGKERRRIGTGCGNVDEVLNGGLVYGEGGICCMSAIPGNKILKTLSQNILLTHLLQTTHPATLIDTKGDFDVLHLHDDICLRLQSLHPDLKPAEINGKATTAMDKLQIMRVFDFEGVVEGIEELGLGLQRQAGGTVGDSLDEGEAEVDLLVDGRTEGNLVVVDDLSGVLVKGDFVKGQARLAEFIRGLRRMAGKYGVAVLLLVASVTYREDADTPSVFSGIKSRPGLGKTFGYLVDTQVLVDVIPKRKASREWVNVIEVLHSRGVHEEGKFGFFNIDVGGKLWDVL